jgi:hypothetical protein
MRNIIKMIEMMILVIQINDDDNLIDYVDDDDHGDNDDSGLDVDVEDDLKENKNYLVGIKLAYFPSDISV